MYSIGKHGSVKKGVVEGNLDKPEPKMGKHMTDARKAQVKKEILDQKYSGKSANPSSKSRAVPVKKTVTPQDRANYYERKAGV
jgi:hypothetical protein